jgi:hypothetical protein
MNMVSKDSYFYADFKNVNLVTKCIPKNILSENSFLKKKKKLRAPVPAPVKFKGFRQ